MNRSDDNRLPSMPVPDGGNPALSRELRPKITYVQPGDPWLKSAFIGGFESLTGRRRVERVYHRLKDEGFNFRTFFGRGLELAGIECEVDRSMEGLIPQDGPVIFIANHPFGVVDGVMLCDIAARTRGEFKILINALLCRDEDLDPFFLPVDFAETREAMRVNIRTRRVALQMLAEGGTLLVFPSGGVATAGRGGFGPVLELPWTTFAAKLILQSQATVVPVFFYGYNSRLFHVAANVSDMLRASMLLHEAGNKLGKRFRIDIGEPIGYSSIAHLGRKELTHHLREVVDRLGGGSGGRKRGCRRVDMR